MKLIGDQMRMGQKYTASSLYVIYIQIMSSSDILIDLPVVKFETLRDQLKVQSGIDGGWLSSDGGLYFKTEPVCVFAGLHSKLVELWRRKWITNKIESCKGLLSTVIK